MNRPAPPPAAPPGAQLRAVAARALARIVFDGQSLRVVLAAEQPRIADVRDRALFAAMLFAATRWWLRHDATLGLLLERPLPARAREVRALLVLGVVQLAVLELPPHAVVAACVEATRLLGQPRHAGLVNALLRRFLREGDALAANLDQDPVTRHAHPRWLIDAIGHDWPAQADAILAANNREAPLTLRVNRRRVTRDALRARLAEAGHEAAAPADLPDALVLARGADVRRLTGYAEGAFSVQDGAAQRVVDLLDLAAGQRVLDACAAPGGKAAHILERATVELVTLDVDPTRLPRLGANLDRLGLAASIVAGDATQPQDWWDGRPFARILLDAPCSASGIIRRQPDIKLHRRAADIASLAALQRRLLGALWPLLDPGGRLVYASCSILRAENEAVLADFLAACDDARALTLPPGYGHAAGAGRQNLPGEGGMDGFHVAVIEKRA
ncbi:16S rRNA (cytosine(967)-C(5))-methyltransferase RsmB [Dokdonella sp.]|uniref:16S rRNA (cytosine(967)-C(5))-methyltransferase RsmB n=1 Tax=Dokdonella sp. TaxID=2291710 RepID=UPI0031C31070|nr:16S rRNA (cytosine(967)-C(5))-methyltransferase RsmB [Dokdonella sp.]